MSLLSFIVSLFVSIYVYSPINLTNEFVDSLQITSNPDTYLTPPQIISKYGYPTETYSIQTPDGFILELHRIPNPTNQGGKNSTPILLVHGFEDSSAAWIALGPGKALAYLLADQGYDVWMINTRGNTYSRGHVKYTPMEREFWDFSFHEMGVYDLPTTIDFILNKTNREQLFCVCDSLGNDELFVMLSVLPTYNEKIIALVSLTPLYYQSSSYTHILQYLIPIINKTGVMNYLFWNTPGSLLERDLLTKLLIQIVTSVSLLGFNGYDLFLYIIYGLTPNNINKEIMPVVYSTFPAGTSIKTTIHMLQIFDSFTYFDYGSEQNLKVYGSTSPPKYNISNVRVPIRIYRAKNDLASDLKDIHSLYDQLPQKEGLVTIAYEGFSHVDFMWNKNAKELVYDDAIKFLNFIQSTRSTT